MVIMVSGGKLAKGARERLEQLISAEIKGVENFHKILVIEAEPAGRGIGGAGGVPTQDKVKIELRPLTEAIFKDALWAGYRKDNHAELGQSFRLPPMLRGDTENLNRATAKIAREATEQLVFGPERKDFEFEIDRTILADMGVMLWRFRLNSPESTDSEQLVEFITKLLEGTITPNEARRRASGVLGIDLPPFDAEWARMPLKPSLAGMAPEPLPEETREADTSEDDPDEEQKGVNPFTERQDVVKVKVDPVTFSTLFESGDVSSVQ
jgi:capsid portal protein